MGDPHRIFHFCFLLDLGPFGGVIFYSLRSKIYFGFILQRNMTYMTYMTLFFGENAVEFAFLIIVDYLNSLNSLGLWHFLFIIQRIIL